MPTTIRSYEPSEKQAAFHVSPAKYRLVLGGYGSGKTTMGVWEDITQALEYPGSHGAFYRKTYPALRDSSLRSYLEACPHELIKKYTKTEGREALDFVNGSRTVFRCLDDFLKLGSMQFDRVTIDEAGEVGEREFRALAFGRLRGQIGPRRLQCFTNPVDDLHWLHKFFVDEASDDTAVFHFSTYDNAANLPEGYLTRLEKMTPAEKRMYLFGLWGVVAEGPQVFPTFNESYHVADLRPMKGRLVQRGWDPGFVNAACVWVQTDVMGNISVLHELLGEHEDVVHFGGRVIQETDRLFDGCPVEDYCDIAGTQRNDTGPTFVSVLRKRFQIHPHTRKVPRERSLQQIRDALNLLGNGGLHRLRFNRTCKRLVRGFAGGLWIDPRTGEVNRQNVYIHLLDALRYVLAPSLLPLRGSEFEGRPLPTNWRVA